MNANSTQKLNFFCTCRVSSSQPSAPGILVGHALAAT